MAQVTENFNGGHGRNVSQSTVHRTLLRMWLHSRRLVRVPMMTPVHCRKCLQWACECWNWTVEQWKKVAWSDESRFLFDHMDGRVRVQCAPFTWGSDGIRMHCGKTASRLRECDAVGNVLLGNPGSGHSCGRQFDTCHLPKHRCRPDTPLYGNGIP